MEERAANYPNVEEIFDLMKQKPTAQDKRWITKAFTYAQKAHEGQERASGEPYFYHVFEVGKNLARIGMGPKTIVAGILHDTIEDTPVTEADIDNEFGKDVLFLVNGVTKLGTLKYKGRERHVESLRKLFVAMAEDFRVIIIKLADRLHNVQTLEHLRPDKAKRIALETIEIHARLADRLGMWRLKNELEDYAFPFAFPEESARVDKLLKEHAKTAEKDLDHVYKKLLTLLAEHNIKFVDVGYRKKNKYSLYKKLLRKNWDIEKIFDIAALRVVVKSVPDCYVVMGIIHNQWQSLPSRIKDYIGTPKPNGYRSIHTTILTGSGGLAEIQIRTEEMHEQAEYGVASHFLYKENSFNKEDGHKSPDGEQLQWIKQLKDLQKNVNDPTTFLQNLKLDFFTERIFVFTPEGDVIDLPEGATPIDFAFNVHTDIGMHISAAKINGKHTSIYSELKSGDVVAIETNKKAVPSTKWLDNAHTTIARKHIRKYLDDNSLVQKFLRKFK